MVKGKNTKKTVILTTVLVVIAVLLVLYLFCTRVVFPGYRKYKILHHDYDVYGGLTGELKDSELFDDMQSGKSFCFLGDSITDGGATEHTPWYKPLERYIKGSISNVSATGWTVLDLIDVKESIPDADVYVIAIGVNDIIRFGNYAPASTDFTDRCDQLASLLKQSAPNAKIYFIAPWAIYGLEDEVLSRGYQFRKELGLWCKNTDYIFIDPEPVIQSRFAEEGVKKFMYNGTHPDAPEGVELFSYAVLKASRDARNT